MKNPLHTVGVLGQGIWLDYIRRKMLTDGELAQLIEADGLRGVTSNPAIFEAAMSGGDDYDDAIEILAHAGHTAEEIYWELAIDDIRHTADALRPVFDRLDGLDGFVSLEVSPHFARETTDTVRQARELWARVDRPNVLIKVPGVREGLPAIQQLLTEGINVNITLLFGLPDYRQVAEAYVAALEARLARGLDLKSVASVASFFLSRIDVLVDPMLERIMQEPDGKRKKLAASLLGQVAVANAKLAYQIFRNVFHSERFDRLAAKGARPQRVLWASTGTKNPNYSDTKYVEPLIGPGSVNTMPMETLKAYRDHGHPQNRIEESIDMSLKVMEDLCPLGIDIDAVVRQLENEAIVKFVKPFDKLLAALEAKRVEALSEPLDRQSISTNGWESRILKNLAALEEKKFAQRLWSGDASLWKKTKEEQRQIGESLGWLSAPERMEQHLVDLTAFAEEVWRVGYRHVVHLGTGESSLTALAIAQSFTPGEKGIPFTVLDAIDPQTVARLLKELPLEATLFVVAGQSGATMEAKILMDLFFDRLRQLKGVQAGENFVAVADADSPLAVAARERKFRRLFLNDEEAGGPYAALTYSGLLPAALMDVHPGRFLARGMHMARACGPEVDAAENPALQLGVTLGSLAREGLDKITFLTSEPIEAFGLWLEQIIAGSSGKEGRGLLPVIGEALGDPTVYGKDRVFVCLRLTDDHDPYFEGRIDALRKAAHPVIWLDLDDPHDYGQEFMRWQIAVVTACSILQLNPFNQPDVQESKSNTEYLLNAYRESGSFPGEESSINEGTLRFYGLKGPGQATDLLRHFLRETHMGEYVAMMAYLPETKETRQILQALRMHLRDSLKVATTLGFAPRALHSAGQYHKGGPPNGLFIQFTAEDAEDMVVPGASFTLGLLKQAQALGDQQALQKKGLRVIRIHLGENLPAALEELYELWTATLGEA